MLGFCLLRKVPRPAYFIRIKGQFEEAASNYVIFVGFVHSRNEGVVVEIFSFFFGGGRKYGILHYFLKQPPSIINT